MIDVVSEDMSNVVSDVVMDSVCVVSDVVIEGVVVVNEVVCDVIVEVVCVIDWMGDKMKEGVVKVEVCIQGEFEDKVKVD